MVGCLGHEDDGGRSERCGYRGQTPPPGNQLWADVATVLVQDEGDLGPSTSGAVEKSVQAQATLMGAQVPIVGSSSDTGHYAKIIRKQNDQLRRLPKAMTMTSTEVVIFFFI